MKLSLAPSLVPLLACVTALVLGGISGQGCGSYGSSTGASVHGSSGPAAYFSAAVYTSLIVEVDYVQGNAPDQAALNLLAQRMSERLNKPNGIQVVVDDAIPSSGSVYSTSTIRGLEQQHRDFPMQGTQASIYVLYLDGGSDQDSGGSTVLGLTYSSSAFVMFKQSIAASANLVVTADEVESAVIVHELGHVLGLVNIGTAMAQPHEDGVHVGHDVNDACVMFWAIESNDIQTIIQNRGSVPTQFDAQCIADCQAAGGK